jgi:hypothetical protein
VLVKYLPTRLMNEFLNREIIETLSGLIRKFWAGFRCLRDFVILYWELSVKADRNESWEFGDLKVSWVTRLMEDMKVENLEMWDGVVLKLRVLVFSWIFMGKGLGGGYVRGVEVF